MDWKRRERNYGLFLPDPESDLSHYCSINCSTPVHLGLLPKLPTLWMSAALCPSLLRTKTPFTYCLYQHIVYINMTTIPLFLPTQLYQETLAQANHTYLLIIGTSQNSSMKSIQLKTIFPPRLLNTPILKSLPCCFYQS